MWPEVFVLICNFFGYHFFVDLEKLVYQGYETLESELYRVKSIFQPTHSAKWVPTPPESIHLDQYNLI